MGDKNDNKTMLDLMHSPSLFVASCLLGVSIVVNFQNSSALAERYQQQQHVRQHGGHDLGQNIIGRLFYGRLDAGKRHARVECRNYVGGVFPMTSLRPKPQATAGDHALFIVI